MPLYDTRCTACDALQTDVWARMAEHPPCPACGGPTVRRWTSSHVNGDEIPGGVMIENLGPEPMRFDSKAAIVAEAARRGLEPYVRHIPGSPHTTSWSTTDRYTLQAAAELVARVASAPARGPSEPPRHPGDVTPADVKVIHDKLRADLTR